MRPPPRIERLPDRTEKSGETVKLAARIIDQGGFLIGADNCPWFHTGPPMKPLSGLCSHQFSCYACTE